MTEIPAEHAVAVNETGARSARVSAFELAPTDSETLCLGTGATHMRGSNRPSPSPLGFSGQGDLRAYFGRMVTLSKD